MIIITQTNGFELVYFGKIILSTGYHEVLGPILQVDSTPSEDIQLEYFPIYRQRVWDNIPFSQIVKIEGKDASKHNS